MQAARQHAQELVWLCSLTTSLYKTRRPDWEEQKLEIKVKDDSLSLCQPRASVITVFYFSYIVSRSHDWHWLEVMVTTNTCPASSAESFLKVIQKPENFISGKFLFQSHITNDIYWLLSLSPIWTKISFYLLVTAFCRNSWAGSHWIQWYLWDGLIWLLVHAGDLGDFSKTYKATLLHSCTEVQEAVCRPRGDVAHALR